MTGYLFIALAAIFNACMDSWENENFFESIFKHWDQKFWYKRESWKYAQKILGYRFDGWHIAKSLMIICFAIAFCFDYKSEWWVIILNVGVIWNGTFWLFYHKLFKIK